MKTKQLEAKVGLFVFIGLVLLGILLLQFSKGVSLFSKNYRILMHAQDVAGLRPKAGVMISGVEIGTVEAIRLADKGKTVIVELKIDQRFPVHKDAKFALEQSGFLGDQYVSIVPTENKAPLLKDGDVVVAETPFNLQAVARSASGIVSKVEETTTKLNETVSDLRKTVLADTTLTNLVVMVDNLRDTSEKARQTVANIDSLVASNSPALSASVTNLVGFSEQLKVVAADMHRFVATNSPALSNSVHNIEVSTASLRTVMGDLEKGKGLAGALLRDDELSLDVRQAAENLKVTTDNLNRHGLWGIMWKRKEPKSPAPPPQKSIAPKYSR